jgi:predicted RecA/RadA family phage recombinase
MTAEALPVNDDMGVDVVAPTGGFTSGEVLQLCDGRAAVVKGLKDPAAADTVTLETRGQFQTAKIATASVIDGCELWYDRSSAHATPLRTADCFYLGVAVGDAAYAATTVVVELNTKPEYLIETNNPAKGRWTTAATAGLGVLQNVVGSPEFTLAFDAVAEVAMAALYSVDTVPCADGPILESKVGIFDIGDNAALDISIGFANGTHATDFDAVTEAVIIHLDGTALSILAESDDGTTEVAATDTTVDAVDDTYFLLWIDCRDLTDIQIYIDGVNVLPATVFKLDAATGPLKPIAHIEKTSDDTTADVRVEYMRVRSTDLP